MNKLIIMAALCLGLMAGCKNHIEQDDFHFPSAHQEDAHIDMRVIKPSDSTKLRQELGDTAGGKIYKQ